jgi:hypothetical protein
MHRLIVEDGFASALGQPGAQNLSRRRLYRILWFPASSRSQSTRGNVVDLDKESDVWMRAA